MSRQYFGNIDSQNTATNEILKSSKLINDLVKLGVPTNVALEFLENSDTQHLYAYTQDLKSIERIITHLESVGLYTRNMDGRPRLSLPPSSGKNVHGTSQRSVEPIEMCREQLQQQYTKCSNALKITLPPSTETKIYSVENLHVPVVLKKSEISPDLPRMPEIEAEDLFKSTHFNKNRILFFGPSGVGKTTEIKMWLFQWCQKKGPLKNFSLVFYIDGVKVEIGTSLGQAIKDQCLPAYSRFTSEDIENMCKECPDGILVILDHYTKWKRNVQPSCQQNTSSLEDMVLLREFPDLTMLVATKSGGFGDFREVYGNYDHVKVEGISKTSVGTYIGKVFDIRKDFGLKVKEYIEDTELLRDMVASPVLLCIMCQLLKWNDNPALLGELKTSSALIDKFIDCIMRHADPSLNTEPIEHSVSSPGSLRSNMSFETGSRPTLSKDQTLAHLSVVAFNCYLKDGQQEEFHLCESDFDVCGDVKTEVITDGIRKGLLVKSGQEEIIPSTHVACEGKIYSFLNGPFQQRLAAKHFSKLLLGNDEDKQSFHTSLQKIRSMEEALSLRNLMQFSCGESVDAASTIVGHMVELTLAFAEDVGLHANEGEQILWRADHGLYQYMVEFILALNYESRSNGRLNDVLHPLVKRLEILSPSDILTRSLAYFLEHAVDPRAPPTDEFKIEVLDVPRRIQDSLPKKNNVNYKYEETAPVSIQIEDSSPAGGSFQPPLTQTSIRKLSIKVKGKMTARDRKPCALAAKFKPAEPVTGPVIIEDTAYPFPDISPPEDATESETTLSFSVQHTRTIAKEIKEIDGSKYKVFTSDQISSGGYGEVYEGRWDGSKLKVAVKRVKCVEDSIESDLVKEIKMNALVDHPNIVKLHAYSKFKQGIRTEYLCFDLILELIEGSTLKDAIFGKKRKNLDSFHGKLTVARKVSDAISHIHSKKFTHSDIKSDNVLIREKDNEPFLCDLGLAHGLTHSAITDLTSGVRGGVNKWCPPESCEEDYKATPEGDIWSLACLFLELFTGHHVWEDGKGKELSEKQTIIRLCGNDFVPDTVSRLDNQMIRDALMSCFARDPKKRPSAKDLTETFDEVLSTVSE
ncbi:uncharacterized protein LOC121417768 [Lytechinus variegatus]|uniref:uncharacterized protein LOC121417768 n=1 Tax=Lytechinus variegatus TaxID=7654 RepID=UPI001BB282FE|nr:uncharacterized protein LOC121417768 [Lytechinus variegatus]